MHSTGSVRKAEWLEGKLRVLCQEADDDEGEVFALDGFAAPDYDVLWRFFEEHCGVFVKRHRPLAAIEEADFDKAMQAIEHAADRVDAARSVQKKAGEADLMMKVEAVRDGLDQAVGGDKQALSRVFAANGCERIGRLRLVVDTVNLEVYQRDPRWLHLRNIAATIEGVLRELGTFRRWRPPEDGEHTSMARRLMVWELKRRNGEIHDEDPTADTGGDDTQGDATLLESSVTGVAKLSIPEGLEEQWRVGRAPPGGVPLYVPPALQESMVEDTVVDSQSPECTDVCEEDAKGNEHNDDGDSGPEGDEEVADPNAVRASAPDDGKPRILGADGAENQRARYMHSNSILEGWVWKRSRYLRRWRRRWLVLLPNQLASYKRRGDAKPTEECHAGTVHRVYNGDADVHQTRCFCIVVSKRRYYMVCDDEAQKSNWMREISLRLEARSRQHP